MGLRRKGAQAGGRRVGGAGFQMERDLVRTGAPRSGAGEPFSPAGSTCAVLQGTYDKVMVDLVGFVVLEAMREGLQSCF